MAQPASLYSGVYCRLWRVTIPALDDAGGQPLSLMQLLRYSADFQSPADDQLVRDHGWISGAALRDISGKIRIFYPKAMAPQPGVTPEISAYLPGASRANGRLWDPTTQGDFTENVSQLLNTCFVCSDTNATTRTANLHLYLLRWPQLQST